MMERAACVHKVYSVQSFYSLINIIQCHHSRWNTPDGGLLQLQLLPVVCSVVAFSLSFPRKQCGQINFGLGRRAPICSALAAMVHIIYCVYVDKADATTLRYTLGE